MFDLICLWVGRITVYFLITLISLLLLIFIFYILYKYCLKYPWLKIKHLFPPWQWKGQFRVTEWEEIRDHAEEWDWRRNVQIEQKNRLVIFYSPHAHFGCRKQYILIKKEK